MVNAGDTAWILASSALVLFMTPGLAFFYGGLARSKNVGSVIMHSFMAMGLVSVVWVLVGYSLAFGTDINGIIGGLDFVALNGVSASESSFGYNISDQTFMVFQLMFAIITPALITGAFAERMKFSSYVIFMVLWSLLVYSPLAHWVWGGGWLADLGAKDFAGGTVVHISSGVAALAAALIFGKRLGYGKENMQPHNVPFVVLGAGILWFGWFGFNAGSALAANADAVNAFVVTHIAAATAAVTWTILSWFFAKKASVVGAASGAVAGLVAITPAAGFVGVVPAIIIGIVVSILCYTAIQFIHRMRLDDALDVSGVHGVGGTWGAIATGLFIGVGYSALPEGVSQMDQVVRQLIGVGATVVFSFVMTSVILLGIKATMGLRVSEEEELAGLDVSQHAEPAYR